MTDKQENKGPLAAMAAQIGDLSHALGAPVAVRWEADGIALYAENSQIRHFPAPIKTGTVLNFILHYHTRPALESLPDSVDIGPFRFAPRQATLTPSNNGDSIFLTDKERDILAALWDAPDQSMTREALLDAVWGYADGVETHTLETHIYRLRQKIEGDPANPALLVNIGGTYRLNA